MSGGVDSSVAAALLARAGHDVTGLFMRTGTHVGRTTRACCSLADGRDARAVADRLGIPFYALNFEGEFRGIVEDFVSSYRQGRTPNPCILCNRDLKFGKLYEYAAAVGADHVATGHYARVCPVGARMALRRGVDAEKDQSYVLFPLDQGQLGRTLLPLGELTKPAVREIARGAGLAVAAKAESQDVCFVPEDGYRSLLEPGGGPTPGSLIDRDGNVVGRHAGYELFTIGQRKGLGRGFGDARYVTEILPGTKEVRIGPREDLLRSVLLAAGWVGGARPEPESGEEFRAEVKIRYRHAPARALVSGQPDGRVLVRFGEPQEAVTPGQAVVAYDGDLVLGGGWIEAGGA